MTVDGAGSETCSPRPRAYAKSWRVWTRFCAAAGLPEQEGSRGALVAFVTA